MPKKNEVKKLFEDASIESTEGTPRSTESAQAEPRDEAARPDPSPAQEGLETASETEESQTAAPAEETSTEDVLDDVRRSLIEEEMDKNQQESKWWRRIGRKGRKPEPETAPVPVEIDLPVTDDLAEPVETAESREDVEEEADEIDDLIKMLEAESQTSVVEPASTPEAETVSEPEPVVDFDELKRQAFQPRAGDEESENISDVRSIAMEGGEEVLVEVEAKPVDPMDERLKSFENALKPYRRYLYTTLALLGVAMAVTASLILFNVYQRTRPQPVQEPSNLPYPTAVSLPGGWSFQLGRGSLQAGRWDPAGAEWLEGTEVCRWVALPWSTQLEAVVRTLNPNDSIELFMSNNDRLVYDVYSIRQLTQEEMQQLDSNSPCLLLILTQADSEDRWVVTALP